MLELKKLKRNGKKLKYIKNLNLKIKLILKQIFNQERSLEKEPLEQFMKEFITHKRLQLKLLIKEE